MDKNTTVGRNRRTAQKASAKREAESCWMRRNKPNNPMMGSNGNAVHKHSRK
jgi:hypothetical protein